MSILDFSDILLTLLNSSLSILTKGLIYLTFTLSIFTQYLSLTGSSLWFILVAFSQILKHFEFLDNDTNHPL